MSVTGQEIPIKITEMKEAPAKSAQIVEGMGMVLNKQVFDGTTGYIEGNGQKMPLTEEMLEQVKQEADIYGELTPEKYGIKRQLTGMDKVNGSDVYKIEATDKGGKKTIEYYDANTGYLVKSTSAEEGTVEYSDYKDAGNGYFIPHKVSISNQGQIITANVESVEINKGIDDSNFQ